MADPLLTRDQLIAQAPDNLLRLITPADYRALVNSAFGAAYGFDPTTADDEDGTAGNGKFDEGSVWLNTNGINKAVWRCFAGPHNAADWRKIWPPAPPPPAFTIPSAMIHILNGTPLSGLLPIGPYIPSAGDRIFTFDGVDPRTWGIYSAASGAWPRVADFPAGQAFTGPAYVWVADEGDFWSGYATLFSLCPLSGPGLGNPPTWILGTDSPLAKFAVPTSEVTALAPIGQTRTLDTIGLTDYTLSWLGPTTLDGWATSGGPLDTMYIAPGTLPAGVLLQINNLLAGTWPSTVFVPWAQITGAPTPIGSNGGNITVTTGTPYVTIFALAAANTIIGNMNIINTGTFQARVQMTHTDPDQGTILQQTIVAGGTQLGTIPFDSPNSLIGSGRPPYTFLQLDVQSANPGQNTTLHIYWGAALI